MSSHYKFEVHARTAGEVDEEIQAVQAFAQMVAEMAEGMQFRSMEIRVTEVEQT